MSKNPPVRPGHIIKECLSSGPMGVSEMHRVYKERVYQVNSLRSRAQRIRSATYESFAKQCQFAKRLGLIEKDHEAPLDYPPSGNGLLSIRDGEVVPATRVVYRLTAEGRSEDSAWDNLSGVARERLGWG